MAITLTLTSEPTPVTEAGYPAGALIYNTGANTAYASEDPGGQVTGFPVPAAGGSLTWDANRPLYLATAPGQTTTVTVDDNSSSTVTSPTDLANAIIGQGLAADIANSIYTTGVRSVDQPVTLASYAGTFSGLAGYLHGLAALDVTEYNSIRVYCSFWGTHWGNPSIVPDIQTFEVDFTENISGTSYPAWVRQVESNSYSIVAGVLPVTGSGVTMSLSTSSTYELLYDTCSFKVLGSLRDVPDERWVVINQPWNVIASGGGALTTGFVSGMAQYSGKTQLQIQPAAGQVMTFYPSWRWSSAGQGISWSWGIMANASGNTAGSRCYLHTTDPSPAGGASPQWAPSSGSFSNAADNTSTVCFRDTGVSLGTRQPILMLENMNTVSNIEYSVNLAYV